MKAALSCVLVLKALTMKGICILPSDIGILTFQTYENLVQVYKKLINYRN